MAAFFFDSSAIVKCYLSEIGTAWVTNIVDPAGGNQIHIVSLTGVEVVAALTRRERSRTLSATDAASTRGRFHNDLANRYHIQEITPLLIAHAITLAEAHALRGSDAVQLAAALKVYADCVALGAALTVVSADVELNAAATAEGLAVDDPNAQP